MTATTALRRGATGEGVRDLPRRLAALGHHCSADQPGEVGGATATAAGSVASVREREMLRRGPHGLGGKRVFLTAAPGFEALGNAVARGLVEAGAEALLDSSGGDDSTIAAAANQFDASLFLALRAGA